MPRKIIDFDLDLFQKNILPICTLKQFDECTLNINLKSSGEVYNATGCNAAIYISCGNDVFKQDTNITVSESTVKILLKKEMLKEYGKALAEIELKNSEGTITSTTFILDIEGKIGEGATIPGGVEGFVALHERLIREFKNEINPKIDFINNSISNIDIKNNEQDNRLEQIESKNIEQDNRLKQVEYKNKVQDVYVKGLFNENADGRLSIEGEGNNLKLEGSKEGLVTVDKVVGNTLVNINKYLSDSSLTINNEYYKQHAVTDINRIKLNVDYTLVFDIVIKSNNTEFTLEGTTNYLVCQLGECKTQHGVTAHPTLNHPSTYRVKLSNHNRILFNVKNWSEEDSNYFGFRSLCKSNGESFTVDETIEYEIKNIMLLEGDYTNKPIPSEYFEGMQSSFEECKVTQEMVDSGEESLENLGKYKCNAKIRGKNLYSQDFIDTLCDLNNWIGTKAYRYNFKAFEILNLNKKLTYRISVPEIKVPPKFYPILNLGYSDDYNRVGDSIIVAGRYENITDTEKTVAAMYSSIYMNQEIDSIRGYVNVWDESNMIKLRKVLESNFQIEEGTQATPYEDYFERTQTVYLNSPFLKGDEIVCKEGGLYHYHKMGKIVLDGNGSDIWNNPVWSKVEPWITNNPNTFVYEIQLKDNYALDNKNTAICDRFNSRYGARYNSSIARNEVCLISKCLSIATTINTITKFKTWLQQNPVTVIYELAEPYYEKISDDKFILEIPNNATLHIDSAIPCQSIKASYTGKLPSVYKLESDISTIEELNVDIVATNFDMDYRLLEIEWALEDAGITGINLFNILNTNKGVKNMALSRYEQAKIMIIGGAYDKEVLTKQLTRYLEKKIITQQEYDELIALMEAKELVAGE